MERNLRHFHLRNLGKSREFQARRGPSNRTGSGSAKTDLPPGTTLCRVGRAMLF